MVIQLDDIEDAIYEAGVSRTRAKEQLEQILLEYKRISDLLRELKGEIDSYEKARKALKVVGTAVSTLGTIASTGMHINLEYTARIMLYIDVCTFKGHSWRASLPAEQLGYL